MSWREKAIFKDGALFIVGDPSAPQTLTCNDLRQIADFVRDGAPAIEGVDLGEGNIRTLDISQLKFVKSNNPET